jgi:hypothetical protein
MGLSHAQSAPSLRRLSPKWLRSPAPSPGPRNGYGIPSPNFAGTGTRNNPASIDLAHGPWQGPLAFKQGEVAKWLGNGLQNRYTPVRIRSSPPHNWLKTKGFWD